MWAGNRRDFVPQDGARACGSRGIRVIQDDILNTLRIEVNLAMITARQALEKFRERALRAMTAVYKRGNHGEPQVSESNGCQLGRLERRPRIARKALVLADETRCPARAKDRRS